MKGEFLVAPLVNPMKELAWLSEEAPLECTDAAAEGSAVLAWPGPPSVHNNNNNSNNNNNHNHNHNHNNNNHNNHNPQHVPAQSPLLDCKPLQINHPQNKQW